MTKPNNKDRLRHILDSIAKIERYLDGLDQEGFIVDDEKIDAVVRNIEIIGEASNGLARDLKASHPEAEWQIATATRNRLIHGYFDVDPDIIWRTTQEDLPRFRKVIETIVEELE